MTTATDAHGWRTLVNEAALLVPTEDLRQAAIIGGIARCYRAYGSTFPQRGLVMHAVEETFMDPIWKKMAQSTAPSAPKVAEALTPLPSEEEVSLWRMAFSDALKVVRARREAEA